MRSPLRFAEIGRSSPRHCRSASPSKIVCSRARRRRGRFPPSLEGGSERQPPWKLPFSLEGDLRSEGSERRQPWKLPRLGLASPRALSPPRGDYLFGGGHAGEIGAVRSGIVMLRTRFAGEEQAIVHRRGQRASALRLTGQSIGIGAAGERIAAPAIKLERFHPAGEIAAEQDQSEGPLLQAWRIAVFQPHAAASGLPRK